MFKKLNIFALTLLLVGQIILGPIATVSAASIASSTSGENTEAVEANAAELEVENNTLTGGDVTVVNPESEETPEVVAPSATTLNLGQDDEGANKEGITSKKEEVQIDGEVSAGHQNYALTQAGVEDDEDDILTSTATVYPDIVLNDNDIDNTGFKINNTPVTGSTVEVRNGDKATFDIALKQISNTPPTYDVGTKIRYALPDGFTDAFDTIAISSEMIGPKGKIADLTRVGNEIVMTLAAGILDGLGQPETITNAAFFIEATFANANTNWEKSITIPGGTTIDLEFQPKADAGETINKKSTTASGQQNIKKIDWEVTVNTNLANTTDDPVFTDVLKAIGEDSTSPVGHKFKKDSFMLYEIPVTPAGVGSPQTPGISITPTFTDDDKEMTYTLKKGKAYKITYSTIPDNPLANEWIDYINTAKYDGTSAGEKTVRVNYGKAIEKTGSGPGAAPDLKASWTIKYNYNNQTIPAGTTLEDGWETTGGNKIVSDDPAYQEMENLVVKTDSDRVLTKGTDYDLDYTSGNDKFTLTFTQPVTEPLIITYDTKPVNYAATSTFTVKNTATRPDISKSNDATVTYSQSALALVKERGASIPNYHDKTMDWKITANQGGYQLAAGTQFVDEFTNHSNTTMTLKPETLKVKIGNVTYTEATQEADRKYTLSGSNNEGFTITLKEPTREKILITYTTDYVIQNAGQNTNEYPNKVTLTNSGLPGTPTYETSYTIDNKQKDNGKKTGEYNYENKEFNWDVEFNFNYNTLVNAVFTDVLDDPNQEITKIKVLRGSVKPDGAFDVASATEIDASAAIGGNTINLNLGNTSDAYKVIYTTKLKDGIFPFPDSQAKYTVTNTATLTDNGVEKFKKTVPVSVEHTEKVLDKKTGTQIGTTMGIKWNFQFNYAQSALENVTITDTFGLDNGVPNQIIDPKTFKVYEVTFNGTNSTPTKSTTPVDPSQYTVKFDDPNHAFVLNLPDSDKAYFIEYESTFIGVKGSTISNKVKADYETTEPKSGGDAVLSVTFNYGANAATRAAIFVIIKTDGATGEPMQDVEFTLKNSQGRALLTGKTNDKGILDFGYQIAEGNYTLVETDVAGYENPGPHPFTLAFAKHETSGLYVGKQIVEVENFKTGVQVCTNFTLTIKGLDGNSVKENTKVTLTNKVTGKVYEAGTNSDGKVVIPKTEEVKAGNYTVTTTVDGKTTILGEININYEADCKAEVLPLEVCPNFTLTVNDRNGNPRENVEVIVKDASGKKVEGVDANGAPTTNFTTDTDGKVTFPYVIERGTYTVFEVDANGNEKRINSFTVLDTCEASVKPSSGGGGWIPPAPTCDNFTVTVKQDGKVVEANTEITLKDSTGKEVATGKTNQNGEIKFEKTDLPEGTYTVTDKDGKDVGTITVTYEEDKCQAEVNLLPIAPTCDNFTLTITDTPNAKVDIKDKAGTVIVSGTTDANGKVVFSQPIQTGEYDVYVNNQKLSSITVTNDCKAVIDPEDPGTDPEKPTDPEEPGTNPEKPTNPEEPSGEDSEDVNGENPTKPGDNGNLNPDEDDKGQGVNGNVKPDTGDNSKDNGVNKLPQTGEEVFLYMLVLGILFVTAGGWIFCSNKRKKV